LFEKKLLCDFGTFYCISVQTGVPTRYFHPLFVHCTFRTSHQNLLLEDLRMGYPESSERNCCLRC